MYYPECDGEGGWLKYHSDSHCLVVEDFNQHSALWEDGYTGREPKLGAGITGSDFLLLKDGTLTRYQIVPITEEPLLIWPWSLLTWLVMWSGRWATIPCPATTSPSPLT